MDKSKSPSRSKVKFGVLGVSRFAMKKSLPRMAKCPEFQLHAIASRSEDKAAKAAEKLSVPVSYETYEKLLSDPSIDAVYIPLPIAMHAEWSIRALNSGKHVLCEKPIALSEAEAREIAEVQRYTGLIVAEATMIRRHPQWRYVKEQIASNRIGKLRSIEFTVTYGNFDPGNIRNIKHLGGGALLDVGCYGVNVARWLFGEEPLAVVAMAEIDPDFGTDRLISAILRFRQGQAVITTGTQQAEYEGARIIGTAGSIELSVPLKSPPDYQCRVEVDDRRDPFGSGCGVEVFEIADQFTLQAENFCHAVLLGEPVENPLHDAILNMRVLDGIRRSVRSGRVERIGDVSSFSRDGLADGAALKSG
jgi:predicted dehydrogenase